MGEKICKAILDLRPDDWAGNLEQGKVFQTHLYVETVLYPLPTIKVDDFKLLVDAADKANTDAEKGGDVEKAARLDASIALNNAMGKKLITYINGLWAGNRTNLEKSGAKISAEPTPVPRPDPPNISRVVKGPEPNTVKIYLVRGVNSALKRRSKIEYSLIMFEKEEDIEGKEICKTFNSNKLIGKGVPYNVYKFFSVQAFNTGGASTLASKVKYFLVP